MDERDRIYLFELEDMYENMIAGSNDEVVIFGMRYSPARVLKDTEPIAYRCGFNDWLDAEMSDGYITEDDGKYYFNPNP